MRPPAGRVAVVDVEGGDVAVEDAFVVVGEVEELDAVLKAAGVLGGVDNVAHHVDELVVQAEGDHHLLALGQGDVRLHEDAALAHVQGACHGGLALPPLGVDHQVVQQVQSLRPEIASAFCAHVYAG